jgi:hypothetical protein
MLHVPDYEYYNSLVAGKSALRCSRKAMLQEAWNGMTRISGGPYTDVKVGILPSNVKVV